jgi:acyl-CoA thioester hydrolase
MPPIIVPIHTHWGDMDIFQHINNVAYVRYLEDARTHFLEHAGFQPMTAEYGHIVARHDVQYLHQMEHRSAPFQMELWVEDIANATYVLGYELCDSDHVYLRARTTMVCMSMVTNRPTRLPVDYRELLAAHTRD